VRGGSLGADDHRRQRAELSGSLLRSLPAAESEAFVDALLSGYLVRQDKQVADTKRESI